jgi:hypothetical protein
MNINLENLTDLHVFSSPDNKKGVLEFSVYVYMYVCTRAYERILFSLSTIDRCPGDMDIPAQKMSAFQMGRKTQNGYFREIGSNDFD